jgi:hypothetical protein
MAHLKTNTLKPEQYTFDLTRILEVIVIVVGLVAGWWKRMDSQFAQNKLDKKEFIENVVNATMNSCLGELKADLHEFKKETKASMDEFNKTVIKIYAEVKKQ